MIKIEDLPIYEDYFKCRIKVYEDTPHLVVEGKELEEPNLIRDSEKEYERQLNGLASFETTATNIGSLTSVFGMRTGVSNLLWPSSNFD